MRVKDLYLRLLRRINPRAHAQLVGVRLGKNSSATAWWGSEPWMIEIGDDVTLVGNCRFITHDDSVRILRNRDPDISLAAPIKIGNNVFVGMDCMILPGVIIGDNVIIGAGSVVTKSIPSNSVAAGVPARVIKTLDDFYEQARKKSLGMGRLDGITRPQALKKHFGVTHG